MKNTMKVISISALLLTLACDRNEEAKRIAVTAAEYSSNGAEEKDVVVVPSPPTQEEKAALEIAAKTEESPLELKAKEGSSLRFINAQGLSVRYARIFPKNPNGFYHCVKNIPAELSDCTNSIFTANERVPMGNFELQTAGLNRGGQNVTPPQSLTLNYTRTLRAALSRECSNLVNLEWAALVAKKSEANVLIKSTNPTSADFDSFYKMLMGITASKEKVDIGSDAYAAAFKKIVDEEPAATKNRRITAVFTYICVAIAMDPKVILY